MRIWARVLCSLLAGIALPASAELGFLPARVVGVSDETSYATSLVWNDGQFLLANAKAAQTNADAPVIFPSEKVKAGLVSVGYFEREGWHYLVVERAALTSGADVTAHLILARSHNIEGPYMDKEGRPFGQTDRPYWFDMARYQNASTPMITIDVGGKFLLHIEDYSRISGGILPPISYDITWTKGWPSVDVK